MGEVPVPEPPSSEPSGETGHFRVGLTTAMVTNPIVCWCASFPYGCCCITHRYIRQEVLHHISPDSNNVKDNTGLDVWALICPSRSADHTSQLMMDHYGLRPRRADEKFESTISNICCALACLANGADCIAEMFVSACKLAQVHHEVRYRNNLAKAAAAETMER